MVVPTYNTLKNSFHTTGFWEATENRLWGVVMVVAGTGEAAFGAVGIVTPEPATTIGGGILFANRLSPADRRLYWRGQKTFSSSFYDKHAAILESFTAGKSGEALVQGIVQRGHWLMANHPIRSSPFNVIDFFRGIRATIETGPDPALRRILRFFSGGGS